MVKSEVSAGCVPTAPDVTHGALSVQVHHRPWVRDLTPHERRGVRDERR